LYSSYLKYFKRYIFPKIYTRTNVDREYWHSVIKESGGNLKEVISTKGQKRGVFLLEHPNYGKCFLKTSCLVREPSDGLADMSIANILTGSNPGIFPRIYENTPSYRLEEYINGKKFYLWMQTDYDGPAVMSYFLSLKRWCINCSETIYNDTLTPNEIRLICSRYITKSIGQLKYLPRTKQLRSAYLITRQRNKITKQIDWLWECADNIHFPKSFMCGDMGTKNILVDTSSTRLYNIDYEELSLGHFGFDAAYFTSSYLTNTADMSGYKKLTELILTYDYLEDKELVEFLGVFSDLLSEIGQIVYFPDSLNS